VLEQTTESARLRPPSAALAPLAQLRAATERRVLELPVAFWLALIMAVSTALRFAVAWRTPAPWIVPDEPTYSELARSFGMTGHFAIAGHPFSAWSFGPLYPAVIAPIYRAVGSPTEAYLLVKAFNCLLMSSAVVPTYLLARRLLDRRLALLLGILAVLVPSGIYTSKVMTESLAYPLFLFATLAVIRLMERQTRVREVVALGGIMAATLARGQLMILLPALVCTLLLGSFLDHYHQAKDDRPPPWLVLLHQFRAYPLILSTTVGLCFVALVLKAFGMSFTNLAGGHPPAFATASPMRIAESFVLHLAALDLYVGVIPFAALIVVGSLALNSGTPREVRIMCLFTISLSCWLAAAAAKYLVATYPGSFLRIYDRYLFYVVPLVLIVFLRWVREGAPRSRLTVLAAMTAASLPAVVPYSRVLSGGEWGVSSSSVALVPWAHLRFSIGTPYAVYPVLAAATVYLGYAFVRSRNSEWLLFLVAANFVVLNIFVVSGNSMVTKYALHQGVGTPGDRSWIESAVGPGAHVDVLWSGYKEAGLEARYAIWESTFFNRSVRGFYYLEEPLYAGAYAGERVTVRGGDLYLGNGRQFRAGYVLTDAKTPLRGDVVATNRSRRLVLYRVQSDVRLEASSPRGGDDGRFASSSPRLAGAGH
jgi:hypothetical protein